ncbi:aspartate/glutamate racemase family protein [Pseudodonghicola flavimaris]|uniref:Aspartate/glutamate racemase family protein n=1 Tax=Pseudodonghicola flavimaris TaxID=3050036 RepID=A0ABT7F031_9RHOB|nr:aspartate/glutamate racemase family protein [Pseudodonghicola flavimaris]MDK3017962.1 aspartate/glutamate racemase family protein [Pseudodonghicola flavimaris]
MHIGLIGGIGPAATVEYYTRLVGAFRRLERPLELTIVHADVTTLTTNAAADARDTQAQIYARHLAQLKGAGADVGSITSLGGHFCYAETEAITPLPLVSAVTPLDSYCVARGLGAVGLLGTRQVTTSGVYGQMPCTRTLAPADPDAVHEAYLASALAGHCDAETRALIFAAGQEMIARGAEAIVLAGTDLGLAFYGHAPGFPVIDALDVHVDHLVALAMQPA